MKTIFAFSLLILAPLSAADVPLDEACQKKIIRSVIEVKEKSGLFLDYEIEGARRDLANTIVTVTGGYSDADADYQYSETHDVYLKTGTCEIEAIELVSVFED